MADEKITIHRLAEYSEKVDKLRELSQEYGAGTDDLPTMGASPALQADALPLLEDLSAQILHIFATHEVADLTSALADAESSAIPEYRMLKRLFDLTKMAYPIKDSFLLLSELANIPSGVTIGRQANLATMVTSCFGSGEVGFYHLNEYFMETFVGGGGRILSNQVRLFLLLKTQAYLSAMMTKEQPRSEILNELFPRDLARKLLTSRAGARSLASTEKELVSRVSNRRKYFEEQDDIDDVVGALKERYRWDDFLKDLALYLAKNFGGHVGSWQQPRAISRTSSTPVGGYRNPSSVEVLPNQLNESNGVRSDGQPPLPPRLSSHHDPLHFEIETAMNGDGQSGTPGATADDHSQAPVKSELQNPDFNGTATEIATSQSLNQPSSSVTASQAATHNQNYLPQQAAGTPPNPTTSFIQHQFPPPSPAGNLDMVPYENAPQPPPLNPPPHSHFMAPVQLPPGQTASSYELLRRARRQMAAQSTGRRNGATGAGAGTGQRQHWTDEEERALLDGIDFVGGPHWSRILQLHGPGGTQSEALRARTQVPLKDKARNVKLFILKAKTELPQYLYSVTGELNRRAPAHVANAADDTGGDGDANPNPHLGADGEVVKRVKTDHAPTPRARAAPRPAPAPTPTAPTALMYASPYAGGFAPPSPPQYQSPYAQPPSGPRPSEVRPASGAPAHNPPVPDGHPAHASNSAQSADYAFAPEAESIGTSAAAEAARMIQAMMAGGPAIVGPGNVDGERGGW